MSLKKQLLVIYHTSTGGSLQLAQAVVRGAQQEPNTTVTLAQAARATSGQLLSAAGLIFVAPEMLGSLSGIMKDFFDRNYYQCLEQLQGKPYALVVCAGSDGQGAIRQTEKIATGWRLKKIADPLLVLTKAQTPAEILQDKLIDHDDLQRCEDLGIMLATGLALSIF